MRRFAPLLSLAVLALLRGSARAEERPLSPEARAVQSAAERVLRQARGAVACILVSRSDEYHKAPYWGVAPSDEDAGRLGAFDAAEAVRKVPADVRHRLRILSAIRSHDLSDPTTVPESYGSGFVVGPGMVLTNAHVVKNATKVYVRLPGGRGSWADIHASDPRSDLAVLRLLDRLDIKPLKLGKGEKVEPGQVLPTLVNAYAPGFKQGETNASWGVVGALRQRAPGNLNEMERSRITLHHYGTLIQTDARVTPGCSGGVLLDLDGEVVGLTTALLAVRGADSSGALGIPFDANTRRIIEVLLRGEEVEYGFLGVEVQERNGRVEVKRVSPGSAAARAGLQHGDAILKINGQRVRGSNDLFLYIGMALAGGNAELELARPGGGRRTVSVKLAKYYVPGPVIASKLPAARGGLRVDWSSLLSQRGPFWGWGRSPPEGVIVREVIPGSPADKARLQPDKVITHVNGKPVTTPAEYYREAEKADGLLKLTILTSEGHPEDISLDLK